ncbi:hypothetical protein MSAN_00287800 [Mycena sanguinolenta]|uniref:Uncharacterized protein n=1 Tax=Mycena sanguinolenta TaxID=230812 RepID=A0A8H6ZAR0_9AGAR|nr:hypothetical protein MSAN_00287800 [Mycena sanguinolenta]
MPSKHSPEDQKLIDGVSMGVITAFRSSIYTPCFIKDNPHMWVDTDWIDIVQLRKFLSNATPTFAPSESTSARVKVESDASNASVIHPSVAPDVKFRTWKEGKMDFIEILSDSEDAPSSPGARQSSPLLSSDPPSDSTLWDATTNSPSSSSDIFSCSFGPAEAADHDGFFGSFSASSDNSEIELELKKSDTVWLDDQLSSHVRIGALKVTAEVTVQRVEYLTELPSLYPIPQTPTAFVVDLQDSKFEIMKKGELCTVDALIKNKDNDSWEGNTGRGDSTAWVTFEPGADPILCHRSRLKCKGAFACERVDPRLLEVVRRDLDPASRDAVFAAQRQTRRDEGTTAERRATQFLQMVRSQKCPAKTDGVRCQGVPILRNKKQVSRTHKFWVGCSGYDPRSTGKHYSWPIPPDVDEGMLVRGFSGQPLVADNSKDTPPCSAIVHPTTGRRQHHCPHNHIVDGRAVTSAIVHRQCEARRTIYVPVDERVRKALIIHLHNVAHNHPMPSLKKASFEIKESYRRCITASGCVAATVKKVDNAPSTQFLLGMKPGEFAPALQSNKVKQKLVHEAKMEKYPEGLGVPGAFKLFFEDLKNGVNQRYIQRLVTMPDGGIMILTCLSSLMKLLDDTAVTIARAYVNQASTEFYERLFDEFQAVKQNLTGKPVPFKRFVAGGHILVLNSDMESAQVLGAVRSFFKNNIPEISGLSDDTPPEQVAPEFIKLCITHAKRAVLDFRKLVSEDDFNRLMDFVYIDSPEKLEEFSEFVRRLGVKEIQDWWDHKALSPWILPCLIKLQSPMSSEDWDNTPASTNTGEGLGRSTRTSREIEIAIKSGILVNPRNESVHRLTRNTTRAATTIRKSHESRQRADERALLQMEIEAEQAARKASAMRLKDLRERKSAASKRSAAITPRRGRGRNTRTVVVGSNSSGRVATHTISSSPLRPNNSQEEPQFKSPSLPAVSPSTTVLPIDSDTSASTTYGPPLPPIASTSTAWETSAAGTAYGYDMQPFQCFPMFNSSTPDFNFDVTFDSHDFSADLSWLDSFTFDNAVPSASITNCDAPMLDNASQSFDAPSLPQLPPILPSPSPPPISPLVGSAAVDPPSAMSKKRKTRDEVDPANVVQGTRARKAPKRLDI